MFGANKDRYEERGQAMREGGFERIYLRKISIGGAITRRVGCRSWSQLSAEGINSERPKWGEVEKEGWRLLGGRMAMI